MPFYPSEDIFRGRDASYRQGYLTGYRDGHMAGWDDALERHGPSPPERARQLLDAARQSDKPKKKRKLSAWNKYVKANANKPRFKYKSGAKKGKLNLKKMAVAFRKTPAGKKSKR